MGLRELQRRRKMQSTNMRQIQAALWDQAFIRKYARELPHGAGGCRQKKKGATTGDDPWMGPLVRGRKREN